MHSRSEYRLLDLTLKALILRLGCKDARFSYLLPARTQWGQLQASTQNPVCAAIPAARFSNMANSAKACKCLTTIFKGFLETFDQDIAINRWQRCLLFYHQLFLTSDELVRL